MGFEFKQQRLGCKWSRLIDMFQNTVTKRSLALKIMEMGGLLLFVENVKSLDIHGATYVEERFRISFDSGKHTRIPTLYPSALHQARNNQVILPETMFWWR
jgi:hypothetical protein